MRDEGGGGRPRHRCLADRAGTASASDGNVARELLLYWLCHDSARAPGSGPGRAIAFGSPGSDWGHHIVLRVRRNGSGDRPASEIANSIVAYYHLNHIILPIVGASYSNPYHLRT